jgi:hypothetical protein
MDPTTAITGQHPVVVGFEHKIAALEKDIQDLRDQNTKQSAFQRWLIGILVGVGVTLSGAAYSAHSMLAARLIEIGTETNENLARIDERLNSLRERIEWERARRGQSGSAGNP